MTTEIAAEIEAAEAQKLRNDTPAVPPTKTPMTPKDWATLSISILAFLVSAATAYFNLIRQSDDLSAAFLGSPVLRLPQTENRLRLDTDNSVVVFANAGNRSATILGMHISVFQPETEDGECKGESYFFGASFDAVTLKSGEIATLKITVTPPPGQSADYVALAKRNVGKDEVRGVGLRSYPICDPLFGWHQGSDGTYSRVSSQRLWNEIFADKYAGEGTSALEADPVCLVVGRCAQTDRLGITVTVHLIRLV